MIPNRGPIIINCFLFLCYRPPLPVRCLLPWKVGYRIGGESKSGEFVEYCSTGYLLQLLVNSPSQIGRYTHVVLDEVHERSAESDMLCLVVRLLARVGDSQIRIVVMSATLQAELFARYFAQLSGQLGTRCKQKK